MDYKIQIISFIFSFIFGILFYLTSKLNFNFIKKYNVIFRYLITIAYVLDVSLIYIICMFKINYGIIHIYFVLILFLGFFLASLYCKKIRKYCKIKFKKLKD